MYDNPFDLIGAEDSAASIVLIIYLVWILFCSVIGFVSYILGSLGSYTIASRRGIKHAWLAWLPVGSSWILGCISDQYQQVAKGRTKRKRVALLVMELVLYGLLIAIMVGVVGMLFQLGMYGDVMSDEQALGMMGSMGAFVLGYLAMFGVAIAYMVVYYFCLYDLYNSCKPDNGVVFLVLSILIGVVTPFLIFSCRKKDLGMPAPQPQYQPPVYGQAYGQPTWHSVQNVQPQQPAYQPYQPPVQPEPPVYQPAEQQPAEPWERKDEQ